MTANVSCGGVVRVPFRLAILDAVPLVLLCSSLRLPVFRMLSVIPRRVAPVMIRRNHGHVK